MSEELSEEVKKASHNAVKLAKKTFKEILDNMTK